MTLTDNQKLEMTKTVARACGWKPDEYQLNGICVPGVKITRTTVACEIGPFNPFADWDYAMRATDALGVKYSRISWEGMSNCHRVALSLEPLGMVSEVKVKHHPDRLTAFCLALHEIAKAKLEDE